MGYEDLYFGIAVFLTLWTLCAVVAVASRLVLNRVLSRQKQLEPLILVNVITAAGLCPLLVVLTVSLFRGIMDLDDSGYTVSLVILGLLGIWSLLVFVWQMTIPMTDGRRSTRPNVLWAGIQLGTVIVMIIGLFAFQSACVLENSGSGGSCGLPTRPGVTVPTPTPGS